MSNVKYFMIENGKSCRFDSLKEVKDYYAFMNDRKKLESDGDRVVSYDENDSPVSYFDVIYDKKEGYLRFTKFKKNSIHYSYEIQDWR